jgi:hypothetical protein
MILSRWWFRGIVIALVAVMVAGVLFMMQPRVSVELGEGRVSISLDTDVALASPDFPTVAAVNGGYDTSADTEHTVNLPSGIELGDLLLVIFGVDGAPTITFPEGWTQLFEEAYGTQNKLKVCYRVADGEEGSSITVTTSISKRSAHTSYRITGYSGTPECGTAAKGTGTTPDPPSLNPSWGAKDTLWLAIEGNDGDNHATAYPANYTDGRADYVEFYGAGTGVGSARRELNASSEDPGTFTISGWDSWIANTVAIQPAAGGCTEDITNDPSTWSVNSGSPVATSSEYATGLTHFTVTNNSGGDVDITISGTDMTGGGYTWTLSDTATAGDMSFGLKAGLSGGDYTIIVKKNSPFNTLVSSLADEGTQDWGLKLYTPTSYDDGYTKTGTVTITATCS